MIFLDTHVVVWLYAGLVDKLSETAKYAIDANDLKISPMVMLELQYLFEIKRIAHPPQKIYQDLFERVGLTIDHDNWFGVIKKSMSLDFTRDPFDRMIVGQALLCEMPLLSCDEKILNHTDCAIWHDKAHA